MSDSQQTNPMSLHPEAVAAAQAAAAAAGLSVDEWLSRIILENSAGATRAAVRRGAQPLQPDRKDPLRAISHQLKIAEEAAGAAEMSVESWLNRAILTAIDLDRRYRPDRADAEPTEPALPDVVADRTATSDTPVEPPTEGPAPDLAFESPGATFEWPPSPPHRQPQPEPEAPTAEDRLAEIVEAARRRLEGTPDEEEAIEGIPRLPEDMAAIVLRPEFEQYGRSRGRLSRWLTVSLLAALTVIAAAVWVLPRFADDGVPLPTQDRGRGELAVPRAGGQPTGTVAATAAKRAAPTERVEPLPVPNAPAQPAAAPAAEETPPTPPAAHIDWYERAGRAGSVEAQLVLARLYLIGDGIPRDYGKAAEWYAAAAEAGSADAQYALGVLRERGLGIAKDPAEALRWYEAAAARNHLEAINNLGIAFFEGRVVSQNHARAFAHFSKAAAAGLPEAQFNLALLYEEGLGVQKDLATAYKWYALAKDGGERRAGAELERLAAGMAEGDLARAKRLIAAHEGN